MKQNSIFSYVKRNNNNSEGVDGNECCSLNVKDAPPPRRTKCDSIAKVRKWDGTYGFFLPDDQILNVAATFNKRKNNRVSKYFLLFNFCNNYLFVKVSNNEIFTFLRVFKKIVNGGSMTNAEVCQGFYDDKNVDEH